MTVVPSCLAVWAWSSASGEPAPRGHPAAAARAPDEVRGTVETPPESSEGRAAFVYREKIRQVGATAEAPGAWATDKTFAKGLVNHIKGFSLSESAGSNDEPDSPSTGVNVTLTDGAAAVAWNQGSAAYDMAHGKGPHGAYAVDVQGGPRHR